MFGFKPFEGDYPFTHTRLRCRLWVERLQLEGFFKRTLIFSVSVVGIAALVLMERTHAAVKPDLQGYFRQELDRYLTVPEWKAFVESHRPMFPEIMKGNEGSVFVHV